MRNKQQFYNSVLLPQSQELQADLHPVERVHTETNLAQQHIKETLETKTSSEVEI